MGTLNKNSISGHPTQMTQTEPCTFVSILFWALISCMACTVSLSALCWLGAVTAAAEPDGAVGWYGIVCCRTGGADFSGSKGRAKFILITPPWRALGSVRASICCDSCGYETSECMNHLIQREMIWWTHSSRNFTHKQNVNVPWNAILLFPWCYLK